MASEDLPREVKIFNQRSISSAFKIHQATHTYTHALFEGSDAGNYKKITMCEMNINA